MYKKIISRKTGECLTDEYGYDLYTYWCYDEWDSQMWYYNTETKVIENEYSGKCLDANMKTDEVTTWNCNGNENQRWSYDQSKERFMNHGEDKCLELDGEYLRVSECDSDEKKQKFFTVPRTYTSGKHIRNGDKCLEMSRDKSNDVTLEKCDEMKENQNWYYNDETHEMKNSYNGYCLDVETGNGNILAWNCRGEKNQQWLWTAKGGDTRLKSKYYDDAHCMDSGSEGEVFIFPCDDRSSQHFYFEDMEPTVPTPATSTPTAAPFDGPVFSDFVTLQSLGKCLTQAIMNDNNVELDDCEEKEATQIWNINYRTKEVVSAYNDRCLSVNVDTNNVYAKNCNDSKNQKWDTVFPFLMNQQIGKFKNDGRCLNIDTSTYNAEASFCSTGTNQNFELELVNQPPAPSPTPSKYHPITHGDKCVEISPFDDNVALADCNGDEDQNWYYDKMTKEIKNEASKECLDVNMGTSDKNVIVWTCRGSSNQQWKWHDGKLKSYDDDSMCMTKTSSGNLHISECDGGSNQNFEYKEPDESYYYPIKALSSKYKNHCVTSGGSEDNAYIKECDGSEKQNWAVKGETYINESTMKCLDRNMSSGNVGTWKCNGNTNQDWFWKDNMLKSLASRKDCLTIKSVDNLAIHTCDSSPEQKFSWEGDVY